MVSDDSIMQKLGDKNIASELIGQDEEIRKKFLSLSDFVDTNEANDFSSCLCKCLDHNLVSKMRLFEYMVNARVGVKAKRAGQIVDVVTGIQVAAAELTKLKGRDNGNK